MERPERFRPQRPKRRTLVLPLPQRKTKRSVRHKLSSHKMRSQHCSRHKFAQICPATPHRHKNANKVRKRFGGLFWAASMRASQSTLTFLSLLSSRPSAMLMCGLPSRQCSIFGLGERRSCQHNKVRKNRLRQGSSRQRNRAIA